MFLERVWKAVWSEPTPHSGVRLHNGKWLTQVPHLEQGCNLGLHSATLDFSVHRLRPDQASSDRRSLPAWTG